MQDLISRQAAIDALDKRFDSVPMEQTQEILLLRRDLRTLPSVQPKIIRCKDCKWFNKPGCSIWIVDDSDKPSEDDYCSFAELRGDSDE